MNWKYFILLILIWGCQKEIQELEDHENLAEFITRNSDFTLVTDSLIACAAGGEDVLVNEAAFPISILFYPKGNAEDFRYFESESADINPEDYSNYQLLELEDAPIVNGYLRKFKREALAKNVWGIVTYLRDGQIHISNPIRIKYSDKPTENNVDLLEINAEIPLMPHFSWSDGLIVENAIYFQVITDANGDIVSGTYTFDTSFRFYDLSNVVLNIRDVTPPPTLVTGESYNFILMAVSEDNWVNLVLSKNFIAQ